MAEKVEANKRELMERVVQGRLPRHVAVIMDGNGRWAKRKGLPRVAGHKAGMDVIREVVSCAWELGIEVLSFYAFSTENWKRPSWEVELLMRLPEEFLKRELPTLMEKNIMIKAIGDLSRVPERTLQAVRTAFEETSHNTGMLLIFALNYGGRAEIVQAAKNIARDVKDGKIDVESISEEQFKNYLYTGGIPDPDLLIRPSGELRISNFMIWQVAYTELWFADVMWPDFNEEHFLKAVLDYQVRERRFGGLKPRLEDRI